MNTKLLAVTGNPVLHSLSPVLMNSLRAVKTISGFAPGLPMRQ